MSDSDFQGQASTGSGKSEAEVAFELLSKLKGQGVWGERNIADILDMYAECLDAAKGLRAYEGQKRIDVSVQTPGARVAAQAVPPQAPVAAQRQAAPVSTQAQRQQQTIQRQQHTVDAQQQTVQLQQQKLNQAFNQG